MPEPRVQAGSAHASLTADRSWRNYHQNFEQGIQGVYLLSNGPSGTILERYNDATALAQKLISAASGVHELHSLGSGWSFSTVASTQGVLLNNKQQRLYLTIGNPAFLHPDRHKKVGRFFLFQAGMTIKAISKILDGLKLSLPTSGASDGQTIAGALSTGTHGAAIDFGAIPEFVVGLHIATGPRSSVWIERNSYPVVDPEIPRRLGAELRREDDALFDAALVGLGAFGIVLGVLIEAVPRYLLEVHVKRVPRSAGLERAMDAYDFTGLAAGHPDQRPYHFGVVVNPHDQGQAIVTLMYKRPYRAEHSNAGFIDPEAGLGDDALELLSALIDHLPGVGDLLVPKIVKDVIEDRYREVEGAQGLHSEVFDATTTRGKIASAAIGFPAARATEVLELMLDLHERKGPYPGALGMRFVKGTRATLGFTRFPDTCVIELDGVDGELARRFNREAWKAFEQSGIEHTVHWGKMNELTPARVRAMYGDERVDAWRTARASLLTSAVRRVFDSDFLRAAGLADP